MPTTAFLLHPYNFCTVWCLTTYVRTYLECLPQECREDAVLPVSFGSDLAIQCRQVLKHHRVQSMQLDMDGGRFTRVVLERVDRRHDGINADRLATARGTSEYNSCKNTTGDVRTYMDVNNTHTDVYRQAHTYMYKPIQKHAYTRVCMYVRIHMYMSMLMWRRERQHSEGIDDKNICTYVPF